MSGLLHFGILHRRCARGVASYSCGRNYPGSKSRARDKVKVKNFVDAKVMFDEKEKAAQRIADNELNDSLVEPSQAGALSGMWSVLCLLREGKSLQY